MRPVDRMRPESGSRVFGVEILSIAQVAISKCDS